MYYTVDRFGSDEFIVDKSKFIGYIKPVSTDEEASEFVAEIKKKHWDATHNVHAYLIGEKYEIQRYSDDGEPSGTSGVPILDMLKKRNITNVCIVATRYFGGIKLGTGGLVRAYTKTANIAIDSVGLRKVDDFMMSIWQYEYSYHEKILHLLESYYHTIRDTEYTNVVKLELIADISQYDSLKNKIVEITSSNISFLDEKIVKCML